MSGSQTFDAVVVGGGPAGATAASDLAERGRKVLLLDRPGRIKPCGGAIPPKLIEEFAIPDELLVTRVTAARMVAPSARRVDMPIEGGFVGMVDREVFDEWLRCRAAAAGAERCSGSFETTVSRPDGTAVVHYRPAGTRAAVPQQLRTRAVIGADGAVSAVARQAIAGARRMRHVFAYHEIVRSPLTTEVCFDGSRCDVYYQGALSPDFYGWVFPHGATTSVGTGTAQKGFSLRRSVAGLRQSAGLGDSRDLAPRRRADPAAAVAALGQRPRRGARRRCRRGGCARLGRGHLLRDGSGRLAAEAVDQFCASGDPRALALPRKRFMKAHGQVFWVLGMMQRFWYVSDSRRERFVGICRDPDVQRLTWEAYMYKRLVRARPAAHVRIFFKDLAHLLGLVSA